MLIYMFSLSLVCSLLISLCSVAASSMNRGDNGGTEASARGVEIRAFSRIKHPLLKKDGVAAA